MRSVDILSNDSIYAEMICLELREAGYNANIGRSSAPDLVIIDLDSAAAVQGLCALTFSYEKEADLRRPFDIKELLTAVNQRLEDGNTGKMVKLKDRQGLYLSPYGKYAVFNDDRIDFSELEYSLLVYLFDRRGNAVSSGELSRQVFKTEDNPSLVRVYISYLRNKIDDRYGIRMIETVRNKGYMLRGEQH